MSNNNNLQELVGEKRLWVNGSPNYPSCKIVTCIGVDTNDGSVLVAYRHEGEDVYSVIPEEKFLEMK